MFISVVFSRNVRYSAHSCREVEGDKSVCGTYEWVSAEFASLLNVLVCCVVAHNMCVCTYVYTHVCQYVHMCTWTSVHNYSAYVNTSKAKSKTVTFLKLCHRDSSYRALCCFYVEYLFLLEKLFFSIGLNGSRYIISSQTSGSLLLKPSLTKVLLGVGEKRERSWRDITFISLKLIYQKGEWQFVS